MTVSVLAAFFGSGGLKAGTPLAIASTPVRATDPPANAFRSRNKLSVSVGAGDERVGLGDRLDRPGHDVDEPHADHQQGQDDEEVGRDREDVAGLAQPAEIADRDQGDRHERDLDPDVVDLGHDRLDLLDRRRGRHRHGHDVVDEQRGRGHQAEQLGQVLAGDDIRPAAARVGPADLAIGHRHDRQQDGDRDGHADRVGECAGPGHDQDLEDLLGRIGRRRDRVGAEDRQRLPLGKPLADLLLAGEGPAEDDAADPGEGPADRRLRSAGRLLGDHLTRAGVAEVGCVRSFDPDPAVSGFAPG